MRLAPTTSTDAPPSVSPTLPSGCAPPRRRLPRPAGGGSTFLDRPQEVVTPSLATRVWHPTRQNNPCLASSRPRLPRPPSSDASSTRPAPVGYLEIMSLILLSPAPHTRLKAAPLRPKRPERPMRCRYVSKAGWPSLVTGMSKFTTSVTVDCGGEDVRVEVRVEVRMLHYRGSDPQGVLKGSRGVTEEIRRGSEGGLEGGLEGGMKGSGGGSGGVTEGGPLRPFWKGFRRGFEGGLEGVRRGLRRGPKGA
eukprot:1182968-Prorocentrum_minimum.AAC.4